MFLFVEHPPRHAAETDSEVLQVASTQMTGALITEKVLTPQLELEALKSGVADAKGIYLQHCI